MKKQIDKRKEAIKVLRQIKRNLPAEWRAKEIEAFSWVFDYILEDSPEKETSEAPQNDAVY